MVMLKFLVGCVLDWLCWTQWSCWTLFQDSIIWLGHVEPYGHVELSGCFCTIFCVLCLVLYCEKVQHGHVHFCLKCQSSTCPLNSNRSCWITLKYNGLTSWGWAKLSLSWGFGRMIQAWEATFGVGVGWLGGYNRVKWPPIPIGIRAENYFRV